MSALNRRSDQELLHSLRNNDRMAFTEIYQRYSESLANFAATKLYSMEDAHDVLHDLFVKLWEDRRSLSINENLKSYLFSAIRYKIVDKIRRNSTRQKYSVLLQTLAEFGSNGTEQQLDAKDLQQMVDQSLAQLPAKTRQIYELSRHEHLSVAEIALKLGIAEQTVKNQLSIALKHLRQAVIYGSILTIILNWPGK